MQLLQVELHLHGREGRGGRLLILLQQHLGWLGHGGLWEQGGLGQGGRYCWGSGWLGGQGGGSIARPRWLLGQSIVQSWKDTTAHSEASEAPAWPFTPC